MILRTRKRLRQLEEALHAIDLVVLALAPPRAAGTRAEPPREVLRSDLYDLALASKFASGEAAEIARGACVVVLEPARR